jgi:homocitrate synthase NifV
VEASFQCRPDIIHRCLPVSARQIQVKLKLSPQAALDNFLDCVELAQKEGFAVSAGLEDASRAEIPFLREVAAVLQRRGIRARVSDTVGIFTPGRIAVLIRSLSAMGLSVEVHAHNDLGMAEANSLCAALSGACFVDTTIMGVGERAGNCDMRKFVRMATKAKRFEMPVHEEVAQWVERESAPFLKRADVGRT